MKILGSHLIEKGLDIGLLNGPALALIHYRAMGL